MFRKTFVFGFFISALMLFFIFTQASAETESFDGTYDIAPDTRFAVHNRDGDIRIQGWDKNQIKLHAVKKARRGGELDNVSIEVTPGLDFRVETIHVKKKPRVSVSYEINVPFSVMVTRVQTSNGKIRLESIRGNTEIDTSNGTIRVEDAQGDIDASTSNGTVDIRNVNGVVAVSTSNGSISVVGASGVSALETSNGSIETEVRHIGMTGLRVRTSNGAITLLIDPGLNANLEAKTSNGKIELDDMEIMVKEISKNALRGRIGEGGETISCRTSNGAITLRKLK